LRALGTAIAVAAMPEQRRHSRDYLREVLRRPPRIGDVFRHFFAFEEALMLRLRVANGRHAPCRYTETATDFSAWMERGEPMLLGTMHVGASDTLGFQLGAMETRPVYLVRQRMRNSHDVDMLTRLGAGRVRFVWVDDPAELPFALKEAAATEGSIALQCDRWERCSRLEPFEFLGAIRQFPFTIYHLSLIFDRPVLLSFGVPDGAHCTRLYASPRFARAPGESRTDALQRARAHFQEFLRVLESVLREDPYQWFNFTALNPVVAHSAQPAS
jgi:predicted LPLAT superfamily acyltransferase